MHHWLGGVDASGFEDMVPLPIKQMLPIKKGECEYIHNAPIMQRNIIMFSQAGNVTNPMTAILLVLVA